MKSSASAGLFVLLTFQQKTFDNIVIKMYNNTEYNEGVCYEF
jgi:hypothetical protein